MQGYVLSLNVIADKKTYVTLCDTGGFYMVDKESATKMSFAEAWSVMFCIQHNARHTTDGLVIPLKIERA